LAASPSAKGSGFGGLVPIFRHMRRGIRRVACIALIGAITGCAVSSEGSGSLDPAKAESLARTLLETKAGVQVRSVTCPSGVKLQKGLVTYCTATLVSGHTVRLRVTQTNGDGHAVVTPAEMVADGIQLTIQQGYAGKGVKATATCPQHMPIVVGGTFFCTAADKYGHTVKIRITIIDRTAGFHATSA
jgi:Domain of unknown function (DUF4333)